MPKSRRRDCMGERKLMLKQKTMTVKGAKEELMIKADYTFLKAHYIFTSEHSLSIYDVPGHTARCLGYKDE